MYIVIELLYRGHTHYSMFLLGGICFVVVGCLNEVIREDMSLLLQGIIGAIVITALEFVTGYIVNIKLHLSVWDYSNVPLNVLGQICPQFSLAWVGLAILCVILNDALLVKFGVRKCMPKYKII